MYFMTVLIHYFFFLLESFFFSRCCLTSCRRIQDHTSFVRSQFLLLLLPMFSQFISLGMKILKLRDIFLNLKID